jgi:hypothetical protein
MVGLVLWLVAFIEPDILLFITQSGYKWIVVALLAVELVYRVGKDRQRRD